MNKDPTKTIPLKPPSAFRNLPQVDELLRRSELSEFIHRFSRPHVLQWIRTAIDSIRSELTSESRASKGDLISAVLDAVRHQADKEALAPMKRVINATGVLLHTNLGRSPLAQAARTRMLETAAYTNVELDLETGKRAKRGQRVCNLLARLCRAEEALVVNNCAAATMLALAATATGKEAIVSRGQLVEIGGGFRLPDVFKASGVRLKEIGTTNRTYLRDYESAIDENTGAILRVHRSNFKQLGFVTEPTIAELAQLKRDPNIPVIDDLGSGYIYDLSFLDVQEPTVRQSVAANPQLTLFSGDKLFGGPQSGIIVGQTKWISRLRAHPMMRAMRIDKVTMAALEATVEIHFAGNAEEQLPLYQSLRTSQGELHSRAARITERLSLPSGSMPPGFSAQVVASDSRVGGGTLPEKSLPSAAIELRHAQPDSLAAQLRRSTPPIQARVTDAHVLLDLRAVAVEELDDLESGITSAISRLAEELKTADG